MYVVRLQEKRWKKKRKKKNLTSTKFSIATDDLLLLLERRRHKMEYPVLTRRSQPSLHLLRSRSKDENDCSSKSTSQIFNNRSKSTSRARKENASPSADTTTKIKKPSAAQEGGTRDGFVRFLPQRGSGSPCNPTTTATRRPRSSSSTSTMSPSAWALSPGRPSLHMVLPPELPAAGRPAERAMKVAKGESSGGAMGSVFRYFRQKKVSPIQEEEYHRLRVANNRLLQWRFVNAKAEAAMASVKKVAEDKLFHVWIRILSAGKIVLEKRIQVQKLKQEIKLCQIVNPEIRVLNDWATLEGKNCEAVSRVTRKLSALSVKFPLAEDVKGDVKTIYEAISTAVNAMDGIEATVNKIHSKQVEKILYLLTELTSTIEHQKESLQEMEEMIELVAKLVVWEKSVRAHLQQIIVKDDINPVQTLNIEYQNNDDQDLLRFHK
ncbi:hypothetical protein Tsubulata_035483 [Turnera subulata]|uniref:QWRF motif-containing protein 7 n=1 Tax=Turnera subulata TaxID=218843 RepID=A0A9Q0FV07_9ROSI|nr:hypothetical protein Tsubulata_035483 [Turnera subulata]